MTPALGRRLATLVVLAFIGFLLWRLVEKAGSERTLVYDLSRVGRTDLVGLHVALRRGGELARETEYFYRGPEGTAPTQQRHTVKLPTGAYQGTFTLRFRKAPTEVREGTFEVTGEETQLVPLPAAPPRPAAATAPAPSPASPAAATAPAPSPASQGDAR